MHALDEGRGWSCADGLFHDGVAQSRFLTRGGFTPQCLGRLSQEPEQSWDSTGTARTSAYKAFIENEAERRGGQGVKGRTRSLHMCSTVNGDEVLACKCGVVRRTGDCRHEKLPWQIRQTMLNVVLCQASRIRSHVLVVHHDGWTDAHQHT